MQWNRQKAIYQQIAEYIKTEIIAGHILPGDKLPAVREAAGLYHVNVNTIARVYTYLEQEGIAEMRRGTGTYVKEDPCLPQKLRESTAMAVTNEYLDSMLSMGLDATAIKRIVLERLEMKK